MAVEFPDSPTVGQVFDIPGKSWEWTGTAWKLLSIPDEKVEAAAQSALDAEASATAAAQSAADAAATAADIADDIEGLAPLESPAFTGTPTAPTASVGTNTAQVATTAFVRGEVAALVDSAPGTLDTLNELAAALGDDPNFAATVAAELSEKAPLASPIFTGTVSGITKSMVGLGNVDNTADEDKPVSTATQTALDLKAPLASPTFTGTVSGITKSMVGLGNVDNTSDVDKPVSTATQTALDEKFDKAGGNIEGAAYTDPSLPTFSATPTFDCAVSNVFEPAVLTGNVTSITMDNPHAGQTVQIRFEQDGTGGRTIAVPTDAKIDGIPAAAANAVSWLVMTYSSRASRWEGNWLQVPA